MWIAVAVLRSCCSVADQPIALPHSLPPSLRTHTRLFLSLARSLALALSLSRLRACPRAHTHTGALALAMRQGLGHDMRGDELGELHSWLFHTLYELN